MYVFGDVTEQTIFLDQVGEDAIGAKAYWSYSPYLDNPVNNSFRIAYKEAFKRLPGGFSMHAYAAMQFLDAATTELQGNISDFKTFKTALESTKIRLTRRSSVFRQGSQRDLHGVLERDKKRSGRDCFADTDGAHDHQCESISDARGSRAKS